jgi:hypothetical protein
VRQRLHCPQFLARHRTHPQAFTRRRQLTFARVMLLLLQNGVKSLQSRLAEFFAELAADDAAAAVTAGAWSQARAKLSHTAFIALNEEAVLGSFYGPEHAAHVRRWRGHRLGAIDGSDVHLPGREALGRHFGWVGSANGHGPCAVRHVRARASVYFDVLNGLALDARLEPARRAERQVGALHLGAVRPSDVVITDRGYCGLEWFLRVQRAGADFVCRVPRCWQPAADALFAADQAGASVTVELRATNGRQRQALRQAGLAPEAVLRVRLVSLRLSTGELEVLATSLRDEAAYPTEAFGEVYGWRWGVETYYGLLKGRLGLEHFSGESLEAVRQDFFSSVFLSNVESVLSAPAQEELTAGDAHRQHAARVNHAQSFHALKSQMLDLFYREGRAEEILVELTRLMQAAPVAQRPQRPPPPRRVSSLCRSLNHLHYKKKHVF